MARLQFRSATKSKGFAPIQLSKASLSEMEKRDAKVLKGLQQQHDAEMQQRETNLQAMRENAAYTDRITKENRQIELDNLQREQTSINQINTRDRQQAQYDQDALNTIIGSIVDFSSTAAKVVAKNKAAELEEEQKGIDATNIDPYIYKPQAYIDFNTASNTNVQGALQSNSLIEKNAVESGEPRHVTLQNHLAEKGYNTRSAQRLNNRVFVENVKARETQLLQTDEFLGADRDPDLAKKLHNTAVTEVRTMMRKHHGITNENYFADSIISLREENDVKITQATKNKEEDLEDFSVQQATQLATGGTTSDITLAKEKLHKTVGYKKTQEWMTNLTLNARSQEEIDAIGNVPTDNGQLYKERWSKLFNDNQAKWNEEQDKKLAANQKQRQVDYNETVINNQDNYIEAYRLNPAQAAMLTRQQAREIGNGTIHPIVTQIEAAQLKESTTDLEQKISDGSLSLSYVNSLPITLRKQGMTAFKAMREQKYGTDDKDITDGILTTARTLSGVIGDGPSSVQVFQLRTEINSVYLKNRETLPPKEAWIQTQEEIDASRGDPKGKFYSKVTENGLNKNTFPNIQKPSKDETERLNYVQKKILEVGTDTVNQAFVLDDSEGMDHTYRTSQTPGQMVDFGLGIREFADKYGFTYAEVFNAHRQANNAATNENKPLIGQSVIDEVKDPRIQKLIFNPYNNKTRSLRGAAQQDGTVRNRLRMSMGGSDQSFNSDSIPSGYGSIISDAASSNGIPPSILAGLIATESGFNPNAVSPVGARGLGQFMPPTAEEFGVNVNDPVSSIDGAARYLRYLTDYFNGDLEKAIYAYNGGMGNIEKFNGPIPGNQENQEYFNKVITNSNRYK